MLNVVATFSLVWLALSVPLDESEQEALKELVRVWQLGASYASAVLDCPTRNAQVLCYASDYTNPAKRNRLKFLRVVAHEHAMAGTSIPTVIGQFKYLTGLSLRGNLLVGSIPREISRCRELTLLDLMSNRLTGRVPPELGAMRDLAVCLLGGMQFDCPIPELNDACHREELVLTCNDTLQRLGDARAQHGKDWQAHIDKVREANLAKLPVKVDPMSFDINDKRLTIDQKRQLLRQKQAALTAQLKLTADQLANLGR
jgi:hypothetical protein